jgi:hypothetical protein
VNYAILDYEAHRDRLMNTTRHAAEAQLAPHLRLAEMHAANIRCAKPVVLLPVGSPRRKRAESEAKLG